jgi:hypothetical protein
VIPLLKLTPYIGATVAPSPNHGARRAPAIEGIVLHATDDAGEEARTLSWMQSPRSQVSCHLLVSRSGEVTRLVGDQQRAWHAGLSTWRGTSDVNSITLGVEIANRNDGEPYPDAQYVRVAEVVAHYCRQGLTLDDVVGHADIAPGRRTDPFGWDWERFRTMVLDLLHGEDPDGRRAIYDRRSAERVVAEGAAAVRTGAVPADALSSTRASAPGSKVTAAAAQRQPANGIPAKPVLCSRTLWLNGLTVLATGSLIIGESLDLAFAMGLSFPQEITMWILFAVGVVNIALRFQTICPVGSGSENVDKAAARATTVKVPRRIARPELGGAAAGRR